MSSGGTEVPRRLKPAPLADTAIFATTSSDS